MSPMLAASSRPSRPCPMQVRSASTAKCTTFPTSTRRSTSLLCTRPMSMADAREGANRDRYELVERSLFLPEHDAFSETVRRFVEKEIGQTQGQWGEEEYGRGWWKTQVGQ